MLGRVGGLRKLPANEVLSCQRHCQRHVSSCSATPPPLSLPLSAGSREVRCAINLNLISYERGTTTATTTSDTTTTKLTYNTRRHRRQRQPVATFAATWRALPATRFIKRRLQPASSGLESARIQCIHILHNKFINRAEKKIKKARSRRVEECRVK